MAATLTSSHKQKALGSSPNVRRDYVNVMFLKRGTALSYGYGAVRSAGGMIVGRAKQKELSIIAFNVTHSVFALAVF